MSTCHFPSCTNVVSVNTKTGKSFAFCKGCYDNIKLQKICTHCFNFREDQCADQYMCNRCYYMCDRCGNRKEQTGRQYCTNCFFSVKREEAMRIGVCVYCFKNASNPDDINMACDDCLKCPDCNGTKEARFKTCAKCHFAQIRESEIERGICTKCHKNSATDAANGKTMCEACFSDYTAIQHPKTVEKQENKTPTKHAYPTLGSSRKSNVVIKKNEKWEKMPQSISQAPQAPKEESVVVKDEFPKLINDRTVSVSPAIIRSQPPTPPPTPESVRDTPESVRDAPKDARDLQGFIIDTCEAAGFVHNFKDFPEIKRSSKKGKGKKF